MGRPVHVLVANQLAKHYNLGRQSLRVLSGVDLRVAAGEIVCLLGPSGAGKSTLLRLLAGLETPDAGSVYLDGRPVRAGHPHIGVVFQDPCLLPWLSVRENVRFGLRFLRRGDDARQAVDRALERVGLAEVAGWYPHRLSGGMAQRVALARALARAPRVLLLDEPFSALDEPTRRGLAEHVRTIAREGVAVIMVTHHVDEALELGDRFLVLARGGRVVYEGRRLPAVEPAAAARAGSLAAFENTKRALLAALEGGR